jgi:hypothetical protein
MIKTKPIWKAGHCPLLVSHPTGFIMVSHLHLYPLAQLVLCTKLSPHHGVRTHGVGLTLIYFSLSYQIANGAC